MRFLLCCLLAFACTPRNAMPPAGSSDPLVGFFQHSCRGYCPSYRLTVFRDGRVDYEGVRFVQVEGKATVQLTAAERDRVAEAVRAANVWQYPARIESGVADAPMGTLTVYRDGAPHEVTGSVDRPKPLLDLENTIKDVVEAHGIALREGRDPNAVPAQKRQYVSVRLRPELNAGNWIGQFEEIRLNLVRRLGEENRWLIAYDPAQVSQKTLIELLRDMDGVEEVAAHSGNE